MTKQVFGSINIGNTGSGHQKAYSQNHRINSLHSSSLEVLLNAFTEIDGFDVLDVNIAGNTRLDLPDVELSGKHLVVGKAQVVTATQYVEKICMIRNGSNAASEKLA